MWTKINACNTKINEKQDELFFCGDENDKKRNVTWYTKKDNDDYVKFCVMNKWKNKKWKNKNETLKQDKTRYR